MDISVREMLKEEASARLELLEAATQDLRRTYQPRASGGRCAVEATGVLVALNGSALVGTAEYIQKEHHVYLQGIAVHSRYRGQGVCRALVLAAGEIAKRNGLPTLVLCAIEETGNVAIFEKLGFEISSRAIAQNHVSPSGGPVTQVEMEWKLRDMRIQSIA
ncbi:GNAT family N-acetyltransferase [Thiorhodococcus fuscus]|uniref:GNAT family N-acetyltransferase n=1 Tax=Thiorhodococcus fuscus TaxID=527200 RepID=A0ABW4Y847_9GAMM